ncbi:AAA family ATPase [Bradyrhizobium sp. CB1717]|uniref:AAA family ATPase n=1 Tax=Bradyrhizobium sp. CB1717 TaxID=3039154 RepID=UPI0024B1DF06|nr:AAA family ATPase [Bradyrhizobium sp. CB1717]WFU21611.1 AAA family ATPase [Bradyrhizobium sp. CB1717]
MKTSYSIAFSGAPLAGKTTLAFSLAGYLRRQGIPAGLVPEAVRSSLYFTAGNLCNALNMEVLALQILAETRERNYNEVVILDRCAYDLIAYFRLRNAADDPWPIDRSAVEQFLHAHSRIYDIVFLCKFPYQLAHDKFRAIENLSSQLIADEIEEVLKRSGRKYFIVPRENAFEFVIQTLTELGLPLPTQIK